jgi:hypothetical protein
LAETPQTEATSRNIPEPMKRAVRQRCGFGCVFCGLPLYEYEHLKGWADVHEHVEEDITLLCDQHHREKTSGLLPPDQVAAANAAPYNLTAGASKPYDLHFAGSRCEIVIGTNRAVADPLPGGAAMCALMIDGVSMAHFRVSDDHLLLSLRVFDEVNRLVLLVIDNQLVYSMAPWDIELVGRKLVVREAAGRILADIEFDPTGGKIVVDRGRFLLNGVELLVTPRYALVTNNRLLFSRNQIMGGTFALVVGPMAVEVPCAVRIPQIPRYLGDSDAAKRWADEQMKGELESAE